QRTTSKCITADPEGELNPPKQVPVSVYLIDKSDRARVVGERNVASYVRADPESSSAGVESKPVNDAARTDVRIEDRGQVQRFQHRTSLCCAHLKQVWQ